MIAALESAPPSIAWAALPALAVLAVLALSSRWRTTGLWLALALAGQAAALGLYQAGPTVSYHHYRLEFGTLRIGLCCALLALQAVCVAGGLARRSGSVRAWIARALPGWRWVALLALTGLAAAKTSRPAERSAVEFAFALAVQLAAIGNLALLALSIPATALERLSVRFDGVFGARGDGSPEPGGLDSFALCVAAFAFLLAGALNVCSYERVPHVPDEIVYVLHARYFAAGQLWLAPPPVPAAFDLDLMLLDDGRWYSPVPPGWPLVLAIGARVGLEWLVNPLLGGASILALYLLLRELTDRRSARIGIVLAAASPWFTFLNMSFMTHTWTLACALLAALAVARSRRTGSVAGCALGGAAIGMLALIRPLDGLLVALALGAWAIGLGGARLRVPAIAALVLSTAMVGALTFPYNAALTGSARNFPIQHYVDVVYGPGKNDMGFGPEKGLGWSGLDPWPGHSPQEALVTAQFNVFGLGSELFGWSVGSLLLAGVWLVASRWSRTDRALLAFAGLIVGSSLLYWFSGGPDFGARYWYLVFVPCLWFTLRGLRALEERSAAPARALVFTACAVLGALVCWFPWRAFDKYHGYRGIRPLEGLEMERLRGALVLVGGERHPDFAAAALLNRFDWASEAPVFAWCRADDAQRLSELRAAFPERTLWRLDPGTTGGPVRLPAVWPEQGR